MEECKLTHIETIFNIQMMHNGGLEVAKITILFNKAKIVQQVGQHFLFCSILIGIIVDRTANS